MNRPDWRKYCHVEILCPDLNRFLDTLSRSGIEVFDLEQMDDLRYRMKIHRKDVSDVRSLAQKLGGSGTILSQSSVFYLLRKIAARPALVLGAVFFLALTLWVPSRILFVQIQGNERIAQAQILEAAAESGLRFGISRRALRSEGIKNKLLQALPQLQWVGVNSRGCVAVIQVREKAPEESSGDNDGIGHVVALCDGIITQCTATRGNLLCSPGQAVTQGQILISGYTDCGLVIRAEQARGEVYALTRHQTKLILPSVWSRKEYTGPIRCQISLRIGKKRIKIWKNSGIFSPTCDRMYKEYYITLPGGFRLPAVLILEIFQPYTRETYCLSQPRAREILEDCSRRFLLSGMNSGSILRTAEKITQQSRSYCLAGEYHCMEMIGKMQRLQIGERNE